MLKTPLEDDPTQEEKVVAAHRQLVKAELKRVAFLNIVLYISLCRQHTSAM